MRWNGCLLYTSLELSIQGYDTKEIAKQTGMEYNTVRHYKNCLLYTSKVSTYRNTPYGFDRSSLSDSQLKNLREYTCLIPYGGILNTSNDGNDAYMIRASFNANKMFNEVHSFSLTAGFEATSSKYKGSVSYTHLDVYKRQAQNKNRKRFNKGTVK